jgi:hypothetical protein
MDAITILFRVCLPREAPRKSLYKSANSYQSPGEDKWNMKINLDEGELEMDKKKSADPKSALLSDISLVL